jgi:hypothetical protein
MSRTLGAVIVQSPYLKSKAMETIYNISLLALMFMVLLSRINAYNIIQTLTAISVKSLSLFVIIYTIIKMIWLT